MKYRVTFYRENNTDDCVHRDIEAKSDDELIKKAYKMPEAEIRRCISFHEIPKGITNIGIRFRHSDDVAGRDFYNYMVIRAESETQAIEYYNDNFKGKRFYQPWPTKIDHKGPCIYGEVVETYFAFCPGFDADATKNRN